MLSYIPTCSMLEKIEPLISLGSLLKKKNLNFCVRGTLQEGAQHQQSCDMRTMAL